MAPQFIQHVDAIAGHRSARILIWLTLVALLGWVWAELNATRQQIAAVETRLAAGAEITRHRVDSLEDAMVTSVDWLRGIALTLCYSTRREAERSALPCYDLNMRPPLPARRGAP